MTYLLQDCYKDSEGNYHDVLKVGYSGRSFKNSRENQYNTHNFGYKFLGEREGSEEFEKYLHNLFKEDRLDCEWFKYSEDLINTFWSISENDPEYVRYYILNYLVTTYDSLKERYLESLLSEFSSYPEYDESVCRKAILSVFWEVSSKEREYFENLEIGSDEVTDEIVLFYRTKRKNEKQLTREEFDEVQEKRRKSTKNILDGFDNLTIDQKQDYLETLKDSIKVSNYERNFVSISKNTNLPVYNYLIDIANERAWEVSQEHYQDEISVTRELAANKNFIQEKYKSREEVIVTDFLTNQFYTTGLFHEKMRRYCEFRDKYENDPEILEYLFFKIQDQRFRMFYDFYGTSGCSARNYREGELDQGWRNAAQEDRLKIEMDSRFKPGERYDLKTLKIMVQGIYDSLGIKKKAKASDLGQFFKISKTKVTVTDPNTLEKKVVEGFKIVGVL